MRRSSLLAALLLLLVVPATARAGTCPALEGGVVDKDSYRLGELMDFFGTYHDFADPGNVTITFERTTDGATREFTASNSPDGSWYLMLDALDSADDVGTWDVTVVVEQTGALDTCTDRVTILGRTAMPPTDALPAAPTTPSGQGSGPAGALAVLSLVSFLGMKAASARRRRSSSR